jgi:hypothetical protein
MIEENKATELAEANEAWRRSLAGLTNADDLWPFVTSVLSESAQVGILWQTESAIKAERKGRGAEAIQILERVSILARETLMEARGALKALRASILAESSSLVNALEKVVRKGTSTASLKTEVRVRGQPFRVLAVGTSTCSDHPGSIGQLP